MDYAWFAHVFCWLCPNRIEGVLPYLSKIDQSVFCKKINVRDICVDVKYCKLHYDIEIWEYFRYRLYQCSEYQKKQIMCDNEADRLII